jgi:hypothetical protein
MFCEKCNVWEYEQYDTMQTERRHGTDRRVSVATAEAGVTITNCTFFPGEAADPFEPTPKEVGEFNAAWRKTRVNQAAAAETNGLRAAFALFGPRYFDAELRRRVEALGPDAEGFVFFPKIFPGAVCNTFVHIPSLLRALSGRDGGGR